MVNSDLTATRVILWSLFRSKKNLESTRLKTAVRCYSRRQSPTKAHRSRPAIWVFRSSSYLILEFGRANRVQHRAPSPRLPSAVRLLQVLWKPVQQLQSPQLLHHQLSFPQTIPIVSVVRPRNTSLLPPNSPTRPSTRTQTPTRLLLATAAKAPQRPVKDGWRRRVPPGIARSCPVFGSPFACSERIGAEGRDAENASGYKIAKSS